MTALQKMAVKRIQKMATEMDIELPQHTPNKFGITPTDEELEEKDKISQNRWHNNTGLKREIVEWTSALLSDN